MDNYKVEIITHLPYKAMYVNSSLIVKLGKWSKEGGDGEMYVIPEQLALDRLYEQHKEKLGRQE